ncbi:MAG: hypothetical protein QM760_10845 [Nibricoccus sp.]
MPARAGANSSRNQIVMYLRDLVKNLWAQAGLYERKDARLQSFLQSVDNFPLECWDDFSSRFRKDYYDLFDQLIPPLATSQDQLLRVLLIRMAELDQPKELALAVDFVRRADPVGNRPELNALLNRKHPKIQKEMRQRSVLKALVDPPVPLRRAVTNVKAPSVKAAAPVKAKKTSAKK